MLLKDKVALVTGASRGIGREIALSFAREGAVLSLVSRSIESLEKVSAEIAAAGGRSICLPADVQDTQTVEDAVKKTIDTHGRIDILVNNAGVTKDNLIVRMSDEDWNYVISVNLRGTFLFTRAVTKSMIRQRAGSIVNVSSVVGLTGNMGQANYAASKAGIIGLTKSAAKELARRNVRVNAVAPGFIETEMTDKLGEDTKTAVLNQIPLGRFGSPQDVAQLVVYLASDLSNYMTGQVIAIDGGMVM
ncbi:MAG: 3-oxoacyl-[acyl-carrier-protein] reductase [Candidatus Omnitrophica bacterium]|nr:3-oxoacyl-[acyl-carrier-protein] reductase [Candidatus Omnitrophota bacterium]